MVVALIELAKRNGHDPWACLNDLFERPPTLKQRDLKQLLPHNGRPASHTAAPASQRATVAAQSKFNTPQSTTKDGLTERLRRTCYNFNSKRNCQFV